MVALTGSDYDGTWKSVYAVQVGTNQIRAIEAYEQEREMKAAQRKRGKK
jgi:Zn/Cd-binding protein ZinT